MLTKEYVQLVKGLKDDQILDFSKLLYLNKYRSEFITIEKTEWLDTYFFVFHKAEKVFKRLVHISGVFGDLNSFLKTNINVISKHLDEKTSRKIECLCLYNIEKKEELVDFADIDHGITLNIVDIDGLCEFVEKNNVLKSVLLSNYQEKSNSTSDFNRENKILYDLFSTGNKIANIKNSFIRSYIQYYLLTFGPQTDQELKTRLVNPLPNLSSRAYKDAIKECFDSDIIHYDAANGQYRLAEEYKTQLEEMREVTKATEVRLLQQFETCLEKHGLSDLSQFIFNTILELYRIQNNSEIAELNRKEINDNSEKKLVNGLFDALIKKGISREKAHSLAILILDIVSDSEYLNKVSATTLFTSLFNSNSLEKYLGTQKRVVFIDTQVLLQLLCIDYQDVPYEDTLYKAGKILYYQLKESKGYLDLFTTSNYVREVSNHLYEAYNLKHFLSLPFIQDFGPSKNIFYNFYLYLNEEEPYSCYEDYFIDLLNTDDTFPSDYYRFVARTDMLVIDILNGVGITVKPIEQPLVLPSLQKDYDFILRDRPKSPNAISNDLTCMYYLSDQTNFVNETTGLSDEPYFITLDTSISPMRTRMVEHYQRTYWYIYPPLKFANRLSIMDFKLDSKRINYDIICMAETNFKASNDTISMLDIMSKFFNRDIIEQGKLPRELAKMKAEERKNDHFQEFAEKNNDNMPIDIVLNDIHRHYRKKGVQFISMISRLFEVDELSDQIVSLLRKECSNVISNNNVSEQLYSKLDELLIQQNILPS